MSASSDGLCVHDLVRVDAGALDDDADAPAWARASLGRAPWVVVRRARADATIPVGIRGTSRDERYGTRIAPAAVRERLTPQALVARVPATDDRLARAARALCDAATRVGLRAGIAGSYGFELASGVPTTHATSDLDAIVACAARRTLAEFARACAAIAAETGVRVDVEVALPEGGAALDECVTATTRVVVKTANGPRLIACPA